MLEVLNVESREQLGKLNNRRLRRAGRLPAVLYGHGEGTVLMTLSADQVKAALRHGATLFNLTGSVNESAIIQDMQWDTFGAEVLHIDFMRVKADERIEVEVAVELRGEAPGVKEGGVVTQLVHEVQIETVAAAIPDRLHLSINHLQLNGQLTAKEIEDLPEGAKLLSDPETVIVECELPAVEAETEGGGEGAEPELIGRREETEEEE